MIIYGLSNRLYCSCTLVGVLTIPKVLGQVLSLCVKYCFNDYSQTKNSF
ncbi:hypothetical protein LEP1GSC066_0005 [Leptospira sp. serovar Kenya str. Sh9]|nr:hypothetical protein LEP1GSC066_0005 [Leptospira sp. serovar Kenya str. Sh9]